MFWMAFFVSLAISVVGELLRPKQKPTDAKPAAIDDFNLPTISETRNWPWMAGTCLIEGGNVTWYGDLRTEEIKKKVKTGWFSSTRVTVNHKYILGIEMMLTIGAIDDVSQVRFNGDTVPPENVSKSVTDDEIVFNFNAPEFMGGNEEGGGLVGTLRIARGTGTQNANSYVQTVLGRLRSAYRGLCFAVFESFYLGTRENIPAISFVVHRYPNTLGLSGGRHIIEGDANPACMIYELLTDMRWGGQFPSSRVNIAKFIAIGNQLYDEGYGLSMLVNSARSLQEQIAEILRHIDGVLYTDPDTGLIDIALARDDYNVDDLPRFDESSVSSFQWSRGSWSETKNTLMLQYVDRDADFTVRPVPLRDTANVFGRGGVVEAETLDLLGFSRADPAIRRGYVALKTFSYPLLTGKVRVNSRRARKLRPGSVIVVDWSPDGLVGIVLRVSRIGYGDPMSNQVELDCIEDIFSLTNASYVLPPPTNWQDPVGPPQPLAAQYAFEAPYHLVGEPARYVITVGSRASGIDTAYETWHDPAGGSSYRLTGNVSEFTPTGVLFSEYPSTTPAIDPTGFVVTSARDFGSLENPTQGGFEAGDALALIRSTAGEEIIAWKTVANNGNGSYTVRDVMRGVLDTLPLDHPAGARIWMITEGMGLLSEEPYAADGAVTAKLLPRNVRGVLPIADAPQLSVAVSSRARKPYPAANPKVNGVSDDHVIHGDAEITWSIRHRVEQTEAGVVVPQDAPSFTDQPEGGYEVRVYIDGTARRTVQITEPPFDRFTYTVADRIADDADVSKNVRFGLVAVNGELRSAERKSQEFFMVDALDPLVIETIELPPGREDEPYSVTFVVVGGARPYSWSTSEGTLPDGLTLSEQGVLSGVPTGPVDATFTVRVEDAVGVTASRQYDLSIGGGGTRRVTEDGNIRVTEAGDRRITEGNHDG